MKLKPVVLSDAFRRDPETLYAKLRDRQPVCYAEDLDLHFLSRYADIKDALRNPDISRNPENSVNTMPLAESNTPFRDQVLMAIVLDRLPIPVRVLADKIKYIEGRMDMRGLSCLPVMVA